MDHFAVGEEAGRLLAQKVELVEMAQVEPLTSSLRHPKIFVKEFSYFLMSYHQHGLGINLL
ncbi:MAG: hypothetical protein PUE15_05165, partial [Prevotella sp.]|nr:hypothetical protein [Prevotella sp.]